MNELQLMDKKNSDQHKELFDKLNDLAIKFAEFPEALSEKFDNRYAEKWTEKAWIMVISTIGGAILLAFLGLVLIQRVSAVFNY